MNAMKTNHLKYFISDIKAIKGLGKKQDNIALAIKLN